ncbi:hypothetical protein V5799_025283 [Amblyomma americanum]|uniref:Uncharacterized protein n=1 Tax=Amblyomma americanum TaxID=6943 RepID=A0AAQ4EA04_AMBAM
MQLVKRYINITKGVAVFRTHLDLNKTCRENDVILKCFWSLCQKRWHAADIENAELKKLITTLTPKKLELERQSANARLAITDESEGWLLFPLETEWTTITMSTVAPTVLVSCREKVRTLPSSKAYCLPLKKQSFNN